MRNNFQMSHAKENSMDSKLELVFKEHPNGQLIS